jgi:hypothetical protein
LIAFEGVGPETAGRAASRRVFETLALRFRAWSGRTMLAAAATLLAIAAAVLISTMFVLAIVAHVYLTNRYHIKPATTATVITKRIRRIASLAIFSSNHSAKTAMRRMRSSCVLGIRGYVSVSPCGRQR